MEESAKIGHEEYLIGPFVIWELYYNETIEILKKRLFDLL